MSFLDEKLIQESLQGNRIFGEDIIGDFNKIFDYIFSLLNDALILLQHSSYATSAFLSITAIEETAKAEMGIFRRKNQIQQSRRDHLNEHLSKHRLALVDTVIMSSRLIEVLGKQKAENFLKQAHSGYLKILRERCLYSQLDNSSFKTPIENITKKESCLLLLFAIECYDDKLIGYTKHSMSQIECINKLFEEAKRLYQKKENIKC